MFAVSCSMELYDARVLNRKRSMKVLKGSSGCKRSNYKDPIHHLPKLHLPELHLPQLHLHELQSSDATFARHYICPMLHLPDTTFARHYICPTFTKQFKKD